VNANKVGNDYMAERPYTCKYYTAERPYNIYILCGNSAAFRPHNMQILHGRSAVIIICIHYTAEKMEFSERDLRVISNGKMAQCVAYMVITSANWV